MAPSRSSYRTRNPKRQTRLEFSSLPSSSPNKKDYSEAVQDRLARVTYMGDQKSSTRQASRAAKGMLTPEPSSQPEPREVASPAKQATSSDPPEARSTDDEDELITPASKKRKTRGGVTSLSTPLRRSTRFEASSPTPATFSSDEDSPIVVSDRRVGSDLGDAESTDEDADVLASVPTKRRRPAAKPKESYREGPVQEDNWLVEDDEEVEYISSDPEPVRKPRKRARGRKRQEQDELEADLEDLRDSDTEVSTKKQRTRGGPVTTQRDGDQEHFALLRRRRAGEKIPRIRDSDDEEDDSNDGVDINLIGQPTQIPEDEGSVHSSIDTEPEEEQAEDVAEEDWIIEDDEDQNTNSRRPESGIPLELTRFATQKPRELFIHVVEWLVKNKIAPAFARDDDIYRLAFRKVDDEVKGQAGSRLISSAWNPEFKFTILARPDVAIGTSGIPWDQTCDACNKTNHPAKFDFVLSGQPYYADTLEPVEHDSDGEDSGVLDVDEHGRMLAPEDKHFYLGTHCTANAQMGHLLVHWKYRLNQTVLQYLNEQDVLSDQSIVVREKKNKSKREKEAEDIVDSMEETGKITEFWAEFKRDLNDSRIGMADYEGKGRTKGRVGKVRTTQVDGMIREWDGDRRREWKSLSPDSD